MQQPPNNRRSEDIHPVWAPLALLAFGLGILAFLVAIEHENWFHIRPASGTAAAMAYAADPAHRLSSEAKR